MKALYIVLPVFFLISCNAGKGNDTTDQTTDVVNTPTVATNQATPAVSNTNEITTAAYTNFINSNKIVLVDFSATWCGPCKHLAPKIEELKTELQGKFVLLSADVDRDRSLADSMNIESMPTLIIYKNGEVKWRDVGDMEKADLKKAILSVQ